jgi:hypothetical protein
MFHKMLEILKSEHSTLTLFPNVYQLASSGNPLIKHCGVTMCNYLNKVTLFHMQKFLLGDVQSELFWIQKNNSNSHWNHEYSLITNHIPPPLTIATCRKFLFITSACHLLQKQNDSSEKTEVNNLMSQWYIQLQTLAEQSTPNSFSQQLELLITKMYNQITVYLWKMICANDVKNLFRDLRSLYLLDGDMFQMWFANGALKTLQNNSSIFSDAVTDVNRQFQRMENQFESFELVSITADMTNFSTASLTADYTHPYEQLFDQISKLRQQWHDRMSLNVEIKWPLCILISDDALELYNQIWQLILLVKRVQMELNDCYMTLVKQKQSDNRIQQQIHMVMNFLVEHIWYYLGVDIIGAQFSQFEQFLNKCESFQSCKVQHEQFLMKIHKYMFLGKSGQVVKSTLLKLMDIILVYTHTVRTEQINLYIHDINAQWKRQTNLFWSLLENGADREVSVLCLRVDFNGWFSRNE